MRLSLLSIETRCDPYQEAGAGKTRVGTHDSIQSSAGEGSVYLSTRGGRKLDTLPQQ